VLEAMACGLPVVTSAFAGVSELIEDGQDGFVLRDPADSRTLAELLRQLHRDGELRRRIGENAARTAQDFTWEKHAEGTRDFLKRLAEKKYGPAAV
jgi:UDP-glucose:(heptosyl)LPS alpha-1,3-glucosyltransferase